jgi:hypothetical protein
MAAKLIWMHQVYLAKHENLIKKLAIEEQQKENN